MSVAFDQDADAIARAIGTIIDPEERRLAKAEFVERFGHPTQLALGDVEDAWQWATDRLNEIDERVAVRRRRSEAWWKALQAQVARFGTHEQCPDGCATCAKHDTYIDERGLRRHRKGCRRCAELAVTSEDIDRRIGSCSSK